MSVCRLGSRAAWIAEGGGGINKPEQEGGDAPSLVVDQVAVAWRVDDVELELDAVFRDHY